MRIEVSSDKKKFLVENWVKSLSTDDQRFLQMCIVRGDFDKENDPLGNLFEQERLMMSRKGVEVNKNTLLILLQLNYNDISLALIIPDFEKLNNLSDGIGFNKK